MDWIDRIVSLFVRGAASSVRALTLTFRRPAESIGQYIASKYNESPKIAGAFTGHVQRAVRMGQDWMLGISPDVQSVPWNPLIPWAGRETPSTEKWLTRIEGKLEITRIGETPAYAPFVFDLPGTPPEFASFESDALERLRADLERKYETLIGAMGPDTTPAEQARLHVEMMTGNYNFMADDIPD